MSFRLRVFDMKIGIRYHDEIPDRRQDIEGSLEFLWVVNLYLALASNIIPLVKCTLGYLAGSCERCAPRGPFAVPLTRLLDRRSVVPSNAGGGSLRVVRNSVRGSCGCGGDWKRFENVVTR